jgi:hypothetical protein
MSKSILFILFLIFKKIIRSDHSLDEHHQGVPVVLGEVLAAALGHQQLHPGAGVRRRDVLREGGQSVVDERGEHLILYFSIFSIFWIYYFHFFDILLI